MRWTCKKVELFIDDYLEGKQSAQERFGYEAHLETCPGCRKHFEGMSAFIEYVGELGKHRPKPGQIPQTLLDHLHKLPLEKQVLLRRTLRRAVEEEALNQEEEEKRREKRRQARDRIIGERVLKPN